MHPILVQFGPITVSSYTVILDLTLLMGCFIYYRRAQRLTAKPTMWIDGALAALVVGVAGARLGYVFAHRTYFQERPGEIARLWLGGLSWHGALVGALIGLALYCLVRKIYFWHLADELALVAPLVGAAAWIGCLMSGCASGREISGPCPLAAELPDLFGQWIFRVNVQLLAAGWSILVAIVLWVSRERLARGMTLGLFLFLYGSGLAVIDAWRGDAVPHLGVWRLDMVLDMGVAVVGGLLVAATWMKRKWYLETSGKH